MRYAILLTLALVAASLGYLLRDRGYWFVDNLAGNLAAGFLGALAVLFFIERGIENKWRDERTRLAALGFRQMHSSLQTIVDLLAQMLKASAPRPLTSLPASLHELFSPGSAADLDWLDLDARPGVLEHTDWRCCCEALLNREHDRLSVILDRYLPYLDIELVEAIDALMADSFLRYLRDLRRVSEALRKSGETVGPTLYGTKVLRDEFFARLLAAGGQLERSGGKALTVPGSLVRQDMAPKAGAARLKSHKH